MFGILPIRNRRLRAGRLIFTSWLAAAVCAPGFEVSGVGAFQSGGKPAGTVTVEMSVSLAAGARYIIEDSPDLKTWNRVSAVLRPPAGILQWRHPQGARIADRDGNPVPDMYRAGENHWYTRRYYRVRELPPADTAPEVIPVVPTGRLQQQSPQGPFHYRTSGDWVIALDGQTCTITSPDNRTRYEFWGSNVHENLNGKHIKDWNGLRRTVLLPGDVMITLSGGEATPGSGEVTIRTVSIYDVDQTHRLDMHSGSVEMSVLLARVGEEEEPDGETMRIWHVGEGVCYAENVYVEEESGDGISAIQEAVPLGCTGGEANPNDVRDFYDDPRLSHT